MKGRGSFVLATALFVLLAACSKAGDTGSAPIGAHAGSSTAIASTPAICAHTVCADDFFVDAVPGNCVAGAPCTVTLKLAATGDFHINDQYPYRFRADDAPGVEFLGTDPSGKNAFSKAAGDWQKSEEKAGAMVVKFSVADRGAKTIAGTFKLSVCSPQACLLEQRQVTAGVVAN